MSNVSITNSTAAASYQHSPMQMQSDGDFSTEDKARRSYDIISRAYNELSWTARGR